MRAKLAERKVGPAGRFGVVSDLGFVLPRGSDQSESRCSCHCQEEEGAVDLLRNKVFFGGLGVWITLAQIGYLSDLTKHVLQIGGIGGLFGPG